MTWVRRPRCRCDRLGSLVEPRLRRRGAFSTRTLGCRVPNQIYSNTTQNQSRLNGLSSWLNQFTSGLSLSFVASGSAILIGSSGNSRMR